ncbi:serine/threonine transporter SstT [Megasphaera cerevisiae]|uniref:serine/threonine transporter SstT n=1 Tax=Megasphaera cerevisiae TaxID=39029 RepID=UPI0009458AA3|nr:serine/threonine transporter SstT [Megasphaera cerevisiae]OKY54208.1 serine/threonine transporter SstT [Megasphaera cerevisiae]
MNCLTKFFTRVSLIKQIIIGLIIGIAVAVVFPAAGKELSLLGILFVGALKGIAPVLVFVLVASALSRKQAGHDSNIESVIILYLIGTFLAALFAVAISFVFPLTLQLDVSAAANKAPEGIAEVLITLLKNIVDNPIHALTEGNYIGILGWAILLGIALRRVSGTTKNVLDDCAHAVTLCVQWIIRFAPFGIMGLVADSISSNGMGALMGYAKLLVLLLGSMLLFAFIINPVIVYFKIKRNPYPLVWKCIKISGVTAFFTRSSAANIPVNLTLAKQLGVNADTYTITIPLGATINMAGAAITISTMTLAAVHTLGIYVDFPTALLLSLLSAIGACGASGVAGGSLLLIPMACSLFGISNDLAMQVVGVGFIIGVLQDSTETALNSSTDILFTAAADFARHGYPDSLDNPIEIKIGRTRV